MLFQICNCHLGPIILGPALSKGYVDFCTIELGGFGTFRLTEC